MKRMVKATPQADHKAVTFFQAASNTSHNAPILFQAAFDVPRKFPTFAPTIYTPQFAAARPLVLQFLTVAFGSFQAASILLRTFYV